MDNLVFVEVDLKEKTMALACPNGCQRAEGSPTGG